ncbi:hypothetical protein HMPREF9318_01753 [Streptococcus urinalis FB127-CNA-2]|uniref:nuclear transport factor 2 family protein n=1 Tax=Streptococcus urinalis TaxID=149016 RepID=UPI000225C671|nr:nuclear transport factor 2 family protein [Streptococcus urinalis]EKS18254.1 hypothetical protein HMPREF9318_01753 [Streptococcus urinalis FB127-CNA-2]VEF32872.1 Uncharacterised protein [Streptococcus urinalis]
MTDKEELIKIYRQINQAMVDHDTKFLRQLLKPETFLIHMTGYQQDVTEWLSQIESQEMNYYSW